MQIESASDAPKPYRLDERTRAFAVGVRYFLKTIPRTHEILEDSKQLIRSSGSVGANYIEACECLGKKDQILHLRICLKEAKESAYWLDIINANLYSDYPERTKLIQEAKELTRIFSAIIQKMPNC
jgi:four helix bundle protein